MFRIGDLARIAQVTPKTLRLYDRLGLLKPAAVDSFTDYRYYTIDQLPRLNRILALKDLGFSLEQISKLLDKELSASELRGMLRMKRAELEQQARQTLDRLARVEARLKQIEMEDVMPDYEIVLKKIQPMAENPDCDACRGLKLQSEMEQRALDGDPLEDVILETNDSPAGEAGKIWWRRIEAPGDAPPASTPSSSTPLFFRSYGEPPLDPASRPFGPGDDLIVMPFVKAHTLPGVDTAATLVHEGGHDTMAPACRALVKWIEDNGYQVAGHYQEITLRAGDSPLIELVIPVARTP